LVDELASEAVEERRLEEKLCEGNDEHDENSRPAVQQSDEGL
jgi:hypothetical protein